MPINSRSETEFFKPRFWHDWTVLFHHSENCPFGIAKNYIFVRTSLCGKSLRDPLAGLTQLVSASASTKKKLSALAALPYSFCFRLRFLRRDPPSPKAMAWQASDGCAGHRTG